MQEFYEKPYDQYDKENTVLAQIKCELKQGVTDVLQQYARSGQGIGYNGDWILRWAFKIALKLTVEENSELNPSFSRTTLPGFFTLGAGLRNKAEATRIETFAVSYTAASLVGSAISLPCDHVGNVKVESNLKIAEFLLKKGFIGRIPGNIEDSKIKSPFDALEYEVTFVTTYGGSINPSWKINKYAANQVDSLLSSSRIGTDDVLITMGPAEKNEFGGFNLSEDAEALRRASLFRQAIGSRLTN